MTGPPGASLTNAAESARPTVEVRDYDGVLLRRVTSGQADALVAHTHGEWIGTGRRRYVRLTATAPISSIAACRNSGGTRPMRADGTCRIYADGQLMGDPRSHREFRH